MIQMGQRLQSKMAEFQESLDKLSFQAAAGGGMVRATVDGKGSIKGISLEKDVVDPQDVEMLEDLVLAAVSEAQNKARAHYEEEMKKVAGGMPLPMNLPGLF